jgi:hypothetical protein
MLSAKLFEILSKFNIVFIIYLSFSFFSCDDGLQPPTKILKPGIEGFVIFKGEWLPEIKRAHVIMFKDSLRSAADFNAFNLAYVSENIPLNSTRFIFSSASEKALLSSISKGNYNYLAVAASTKEEISLNRNDWFVIGLYLQDNDSSKAGKITIPKDEIVENVIIICDFNSLPPQPPK